MATYQKRSGSWRAIIRRKGYETLTRTFDKLEEAKTWAGETEAQMKKKTYIDTREAEETTLGSALDRYEREVVVAKKGAAQDRRRVAAWKRDPLANRPLASIRGADLATWRDKRLAAGISGGTVRRDLAIISHLFNLARKEWGLDGLSNPIDNIRVPPQGKPRDRRFNQSPAGNEEAEETRLLAACEASANPWLAPMVKLALVTTMRKSELLALRWDGIDLPGKVAHVEDSKNGEARDVALTAAARTVLANLPRSLDGRVFPISVGRLDIHWRRARDAAGLKDFHFHDLRHEGTSQLFEKGLNPMEASTITGHKSLSMLKRYTHLRAADLADKLDRGNG